MTNIPLNNSNLGLAGAMGLSDAQECDSDFGNPPRRTPIISGQPQWIYANEAVILSLPASLCRQFLGRCYVTAQISCELLKPIAPARPLTGGYVTVLIYGKTNRRPEARNQCVATGSGLTPYHALKPDPPKVPGV